MHFDKYDVIRKVLEVIQQDIPLEAGSLTKEHIVAITNIFQQADGGIIRQRIG